MEKGTDAGTILRSTAKGNGTPGHRRVFAEQGKRCVSLRGVWLRTFHIRHQIRFALRLAEFLRSGEIGRSGNAGRPQPRNGSNGSDVSALRRTSGPRI